jgi:hypothetical protein
MINRYHHALSCIRALLVSGLMMAYLASAIDIDQFHQLLHGHQPVEHSSDQEKDPCHRTIVHNDKEQGCKHDSHFVKTDNCSFSHIIFTIYYDFNSLSIENEIVDESFSLSSITRGISSISQLEISPRGPPTL